MGRSLFTGAMVFDGEAFIDGQGILVEDGEIAALLPVGEAVGADTTIDPFGNPSFCQNFQLHFLGGRFLSEGWGH